MRKILAVLSLGGLLAVGCGSPSTPTKPAATGKQTESTAPKTGNSKMESAKPEATTPSTAPATTPKEGKPGEKKDDKKN